MKCFYFLGFLYNSFGCCPVVIVAVFQGLGSVALVFVLDCVWWSVCRNWKLRDNFGGSISISSVCFKYVIMIYFSVVSIFLLSVIYVSAIFDHVSCFWGPLPTACVEVWLQSFVIIIGVLLACPFMGVCETDFMLTWFE